MPEADRKVQVKIVWEPPSPPSQPAVEPAPSSSSVPIEGVPPSPSASDVSTEGDVAQNSTSGFDSTATEDDSNPEMIQVTYTDPQGFQRTQDYHQSQLMTLFDKKTTEELQIFLTDSENFEAISQEIEKDLRKKLSIFDNESRVC